jgi:hypothetical protein
MVNALHEQLFYSGGGKKKNIVNKRPQALAGFSSDKARYPNSIQALYEASAAAASAVAAVT